MRRRLLVLGCLLAFCLAGALGCSGEEKPSTTTAPRAPRLPKPAGQDKKPGTDKKP
jgi:hypothetical protein